MPTGRLPEMLTRLRTWRARQRRKECAIRRAVQQFREKSGHVPMGASVLHLSPQETIVRVMYVTNHIPSDRAWFAVSEIDASVRELTFRDVAGLEKPWR
jgi:hypothetical protein